MIRVRAKSRMNGEVLGPGLPGHRDFTNSYMNTRTWGITRDGQGCHHLPPVGGPYQHIYTANISPKRRELYVSTHIYLCY